jgi:chromosome segregation ATPase
VKINNDLKSKLIESESNYTMHSDEFKSLIKRNSVLSKKIEENEKEKEKHSAEIAYKEERLQALRQMNTKLEQKSSQILKKWETFKLFEEKSNQVSNNCNTLLEVIEDLNKKLSSTIEENTGLQKAVDNL